MTSDVQQSRDGQLKQAFQKHLPQRLRGIQRRTRALCQGGWDINTLLLIYNEIQQLAGSSGGYGMVDISEQLFSLEVYLSAFMESGRVPDDRQTVEIVRLIDALDDLVDGDAAALDERIAQRPAAVSENALHWPMSEAIIEMTGLPSLANVPAFVTPPENFLPGADDLSTTAVGVAEHAPAPGFAEDHVSVLPKPFDDPEIRPMSGVLTIGNLANKLVTGEAQYAIQESDDIGESWQEDVARSLDTVGLPQDRSRREPDESRLARDEPPSGETLTPAAPVPANRSTIYFLRQPSAVSDKLLASLRADYEVQSFDQLEEFREVLSALAPNAVLVEGNFVDEIEALSPVVDKIRRKQNGPMPMVAFGNDGDVAKRLKVLRAGADAFLRTDASQAEVQERLQDLLQTAVTDPYRVMIVEDDRSQAMFAEAILRKAGMAVSLERNPLKVMDALEAFRPDLILMDLYMPDCDGMELTAIIRERDDFVNTPIVFLSGESDTDKHFDALLAGGDDFLAKPIRPRHLIQAVTNRVRRARTFTRQHQAPRQDTVTGLSERPYLLEQINLAIANVSPEGSDTPGAVLYVEIDQPFEVRQRVGLTGFERLVDQLGPLLTSRLAPREMAARYGDSAYCLLMPERALDGIEGLAREMVAQIDAFDFDADAGQRQRITVSIGICPLSHQLADAGAAIASAERACNSGHGKACGRVSMHALATTRKAPTQRSLNALIEVSLEQNRLQVLYQPIVSLQGDRTEQYQALLRLPGSDGKPIEAARFIPVAERSGLIPQVDHWIIQKAMSVIDERQRHRRPLRLFVNQSLQSLAKPDAIARLAKSLHTRGVGGKLLVIELKLHEIVNDIEQARSCCEELVKIGVALSLGGFDGSKQAFDAVARLPVSYVKLRQANEKMGMAELLGGNVADIVDTLHERQKLVIVPAIEDARTAARLWPTGVDYIQGNFVQRPNADLMYQFSDAHG